MFGLSSLLSVPSSPVSVLLPLALPASSAYHRRRAAAAAAAVNFRRSLRRSPRNTDYCRNPNPLEYQVSPTPETQIPFLAFSVLILR